MSAPIHALDEAGRPTDPAAAPGPCGPVMHLDDVELQPWPAGASMSAEAATRYAARTGAIGTRIGARRLGYNLTVVPPGAAAYPAHCHRVNEEMFFILSGTGVLRWGTQRHAVRAGTFIACPPGGRDTAHQIVNTGDVPLHYLAVSTKASPEVVHYPDSGKSGLLVEFRDGSGPQRLVHLWRDGESVPYWEGE
jgi:uncharacterized cupin superfamily protein